MLFRLCVYIANCLFFLYCKQLFISSYSKLKKGCVFMFCDLNSQSGMERMVLEILDNYSWFDDNSTVLAPDHLLFKLLKSICVYKEWICAPTLPLSSVQLEEIITSERLTRLNFPEGYLCKCIAESLQIFDAGEIKYDLLNNLYNDLCALVVYVYTKKELLPLTKPVLNSAINKLEDFYS